MSLSTRLTAMLGIRHPILLAPMDLVADARLAGAVSAAGGLGMIGGGYGDEAWLQRELEAAGGARVGVGFITWSMAQRPHLLDLALAKKPPAIMLSFGDVRPHAERIKQSGTLLLCQVQTLAQAKDAASCGADVLVAQGGEAGGHGISRGTFALVPAVADAAPDIPVVAAGGVADGRGLAAALMLGADGVLLGTRFYASQEAAGLAEAKRRIVAANGDQTMRSILFDIARQNVWPAPFTGRVLHNGFTDRWRGREAELLQHQRTEALRYAAARSAGDFDTAAVIAGEAVDLISDIPPAGAIVERIARDAAALLGKANNRYRLTPRD